MAVVPDVDASGAPETPANQMAEKKKQKNMTIAGLVLGGIGLAVAVMIHRRSAASASNTASAPASTSIDPTTGVPYSSEESAYVNGQGASGASQGTFSAGESALMSQLQQYQTQTNQQFAAQSQQMAAQNQGNLAIGTDLVAGEYDIAQEVPNVVAGRPVTHGFIAAPYTAMQIQNAFAGTSASGATA